MGQRGNQRTNNGGGGRKVGGEGGSKGQSRGYGHYDHTKTGKTFLTYNPNSF